VAEELWPRLLTEVWTVLGGEWPPPAPQVTGAPGHLPSHLPVEDTAIACAGAALLAASALQAQRGVPAHPVRQRSARMAMTWFPPTAGRSGPHAVRHTRLDYRASRLKVSTAVRDNGVIERIDAFCDAVPRRRARAEEYGPLVIFVPTGSGWPYYARPRRGSRPPVTAADIRAVRARQRELIIPESFEWIEQTAPEMAVAAAEAALEVRAHPLMVLVGPTQVPPMPPGITVRIIAPEDTELDRIWAVPAVAFSHPGTGAGEAGEAERDKIAADHDAGTIAMLRERLRSGHSVLAAAFGPDGPLAAGSCQAVDNVAEITGVGVLPSVRRQGLGAAVTALLAADAQDRGVQTIFLSASDGAVARVYARIGFREIGTAMIAEPAR
jgi:ribosomal protein S18 acetylase RimI-like enzyme